MSDGKFTGFYLAPLFDPDDLTGAILAKRNKDVADREAAEKAKRERSSEFCFSEYDEIPIEKLEAFIAKAKAQGSTLVSVSVQWGYYHDIDGITLIADPNNKPAQ